MVNICHAGCLINDNPRIFSTKKIRCNGKKSKVKEE